MLEKLVCMKPFCYILLYPWRSFSLGWMLKLSTALCMFSEKLIKRKRKGYNFLLKYMENRLTFNDSKKFFDSLSHIQVNHNFLKLLNLCEKKSRVSVQEYHGRGIKSASKNIALLKYLEIQRLFWFCAEDSEFLITYCIPFILRDAEVVILPNIENVASFFSFDY
ncbi:Protein of unknown function [Gryllus bimaculatus]|nr:Protein of unknown function [Gryllus bimaculatus]